LDIAGAGQRREAAAEMDDLVAEGGGAVRGGRLRERREHGGRNGDGAGEEVDGQAWSVRRGSGGEAVAEVQSLEPSKPTGPREISMEEKGLKFIGKHSKLIWMLIFAAFALVLITK
jgi:hypothetical protein